MIDVVPNAGVIVLGKEGENRAVRVTLPNIRAGVGSILLLHQRSYDQKPYPVPVVEADGGIIWTVSSTDTAYPGRGQAELQWLGTDGAVVKSVTYQTNTIRALAAPGAVPDEPLKPYTQAVAKDAQAAKDAAARATEAAQSAEASAGQAGISAENAAKSLKKLEDGIASGDFRGEKGDKGDRGEVGQTGPQGLPGPAGPAGDTTAADAAAAAAQKSAEDAQKNATAAQAAAQEAQKAAETAVLYTEQNLTDSQQERARANIGAADKARQNVLVGTETGNPISVDDAFSAPLCGLTVYGKSTQDGTPTPDAPVPIVSAGDGGSVAVTLSDGNNKTQTLTLPTPNGLPGIPVTSGGNYTDQSGQQWVCDEVDFSNCIRIKRVSSFVVAANMVRSLASNPADYCAIVIPPPDFKAIFNNARIVLMSNRFRFEKDIKNEGILFGYGNVIRLYFDPSKIKTLADVKEFVTANHINITYETVDPIQTPLTAAELAAYKALATYSPDIVVQAADGAGVKLEYQRDVNIVIKNLEDAIASMTTT